MRAILAFAWSGAGCGSGQSATDAAMTDDACVPSECRAQASYGRLGAVSGHAHVIQESGNPLWWVGDVEDVCGAATFAVAVILYEGRGVFVDGIAPGTYEIDGAELARDTCGVCVQVTDQLETGDPTCYFAASGNVILTMTEASLVGSLESVQFEQATCGTFEALEGECSISIEQLAFDEPIEPIACE